LKESKQLQSKIAMSRTRNEMTGRPFTVRGADERARWGRGGKSGVKTYGNGGDTWFCKSASESLSMFWTIQR